ncbi:MAG: bifunctional nuclease family protein [Phycisphaerales bacterium]|nr:bifunctional nuclease family protein [Phycisphaerales bacterium]
MDLARVIIRETGDSQIIILREREGQRQFPILIGMPEAIAIERRAKGVETQRPLTHDLMASIIDKLDGELEEIVISDLREHTFFATLKVRRNGDLILIDARPSDAIALGVGTETPILVEEEVLQAVCAPDGTEPADPDG